MIVAIDGPAGAGKSTVARALAEELGFLYLDTGAMYRALTWLAARHDVSIDDGAALAALATKHPVRFDADGRVHVDDRDVTAEIRSPEIDRRVSSVSRHPAVRQVMRERQREIGESGDAVIEGRDIGAIVAPDAEVKIFLDASPEERARRRLGERPGAQVDELASELRRRDAADAVNMTPAPDAIRVDTTGLGVHEVVERLERLVREWGEEG